MRSGMASITRSARPSSRHRWRPDPGEYLVPCGVGELSPADRPVQGGAHPGHTLVQETLVGLDRVDSAAAAAISSAMPEPIRPDRSLPPHGCRPAESRRWSFLAPFVLIRLNVAWPAPGHPRGADQTRAFSPASAGPRSDQRPGPKTPRPWPLGGQPPARRDADHPPLRQGSRNAGQCAALPDPGNVRSTTRLLGRWRLTQQVATCLSIGGRPPRRGPGRRRSSRPR